MIAALYVEKNGVYYGLPDVDPWDEERDARLYAGPWPVVAHPPCNRWSIMAQCRPGHRNGEDGGTFAHALDCVRRFGGVLEHPALTLAWTRYDLPQPCRGAWASGFWDGGWVTEVDQAQYGHPARKTTWLYVYGVEDLPALDWGGFWRRDHTVRWHGHHNGERSRTPLAFRDVLLDLARSASRAIEREAMPAAEASN